MQHGVPFTEMWRNGCRTKNGSNIFKKEQLKELTAKIHCEIRFTTIVQMATMVVFSYRLYQVKPPGNRYMCMVAMCFETEQWQRLNYLLFRLTFFSNSA